MNNEPVLTAAGVSAALGAILVAFGVHVDDNTTKAITAAAAVVVPLLAGWLARARVTPVR